MYFLLNWFDMLDPRRASCLLLREIHFQVLLVLVTHVLKLLSNMNVLFPQIQIQKKCNPLHEEYKSRFRFRKMQTPCMKSTEADSDSEEMQTPCMKTTDSNSEIKTHLSWRKIWKVYKQIYLYVCIKKCSTCLGSQDAPPQKVWLANSQPECWLCGGQMSKCLGHRFQTYNSMQFRENI